MEIYSADFLYSENQTFHDYGLVVKGGQIHAFEPLSTLRQNLLHTTPKPEFIHFPEAAIIPGFVNAHTHSFQSLLKGLCDDTDFFTWRDKGLYDYSRLMTATDLYHGALFAFGEMLKNGITTVCDFFYIHDQANDNAQEIIRAAQDLGIRLVLARTMYDWDGAPKRYQESVQQAVENTEALIQSYETDPKVSVIPAPHSLHGASPEMIQAGAALAEKYHLPFHIHVAEGQYERQMMEERHGLSPIRFLNHLHVLSPAMAGIHCVWLDDDDIALMAEKQAKIIYCPSSNMFLGDGITRMTELQQAGVCMALGTDGGCSNNRASIMEEMRMANLLQKVRHLDASQTKAEDAFLMGTLHGGSVLGQRLGKLAPGHAADFVVVNLADLSLQPVQAFAKNLVYSAMPSALQSVYVGGECVMQSGSLLRVSERDIVHAVQGTMQSLMNPLTTRTTGA